MAVTKTQDLFGRKTIRQTLVAGLFVVAMAQAAPTLGAGRVKRSPAPIKQASAVGSWTALKDWGVNAIHMQLLTTGKIMYYDDVDKHRQWNPATGEVTVIPSPEFNAFCGATAHLLDGTVFNIGGTHFPAQSSPHPYIFNPITSGWTKLPAMNRGRWYGTTLTLPNGNILVCSGGTNDTPMQVWQSSGSWRDLTDTWGPSWFYPRMFVAPNGLVFECAPDDETRYLDTSGVGKFIEVGDTLGGYRLQCSAAMYLPGKIILTGGVVNGSDPSHYSAEIIDLNDPAPAWKYTSSMTYRRKNHNAVILADGRVMAVGGESTNGTSPLPCEIWDPATEKWTVVASIGVARGYHSTALLLPDGRVVSAGAAKTSYQVYSPDYLFKGPRPTITSMPATVILGSTINVETPNAGEITRVNMIRLGTCTHTVNFDQRFIPLDFTAGSNSLSVTIPASQNNAVPGPYMLFLLNSAGVPSVAKVFLVHQPPLAPPSNLTATVLSPQRTRIDWTDNSGEETNFSIERSVNGGSFVAYATVPYNVTSFQDYPAAEQSTFSYRVSAINAGGSSTPSNIATVTTPALILPKPPVKLTGLAGGLGEYYLSWTPGDDMQTGYVIERSVDGFKNQNTTVIPQTVTTYLVTGLTPGTKYFFRVRATNRLGASVASNVVAPLILKADDVAGVSVSNDMVTGGADVIGTVTFVSTVAADTLVTLSSGNAKAHVPPSITVPAGSSSANFTITTDRVTAQVAGPINASHNGLTKSVTLTVKPTVLTSLTLSSTSVYGGNSVIGTLTFASPVGGDTTIPIASTNSGAHPPADVVVPSGTSIFTFPIATDQVTAAVAGAITATYAGVSKSITLMVKPAVLTTLGLNITSVFGGASVIGTVTFAANLPVDTTVVLGSANPAAHVPATVIVPAGSSSATFPITTDPVTSNVTATISAAYAGVSKTINMTIKAPTYSSFTLAPSTVVGGNNVVGTITMSSPVAVDTAVTLTNANAKASLPASTITILAGSSSVSFTMTTTMTAATTVGAVTAKVGTVTKSVTLKVTP